MNDSATATFEHSATFRPAEVSGTLSLGPLEVQYQELFSDALADGVITTEERAGLERAAENLGLDRRRLLALESAMIAAYESHHRVRIVERYEEPAPSLVLPASDAAASGAVALVARIRELEARVRELEEELRRAQAAMNVEVDLVELDAAAGVAEEDPEEIWRRVRYDATAPSPHRDLFRIYAARGDADRAWCVAQALVALDAASVEQRELFAAHQTSNLIAPRAGVSPAAWHDHLLHPEQDVLTGEIFGVIAPALLIGRSTVLRRDGKLHRPAADTLQDPARTTITAVRAVPWAASILGLATPTLYVEKEREGGYGHLPDVPPYTVVGRRVLSGCSQAELAFMAARHLTYYRQEHFVRTLWSAVPDLEELFLAALTIGNDRLPIAEGLRRRVAPIAAAIEPMLDPEQLDRLRAAYLRFVEVGGRTNLLRWSIAVEKTACRAGLLVSNDLATALAVVAEEEGLEGPLAKDLLAFAVSERYFALRRDLGIALA